MSETPDEIEDEKIESLLHQYVGTKEWGEETIEVAYYRIDEICDDAGLPDEVNQVAKAIYQRSLDERVIQRHRLCDLTCGAVYAACRTQNQAYSARELARSGEIGEKPLKKAFSDLVNTLNLKAGPVDPRNYVPRYCEELILSEKVEERAVEILDVCEEHGAYSGKSPTAFAAAAIYLACLLENEKKTQQEVADVCKSGVKTIRNRYREQLELLAGEDLDY
ncbi:transcription initiation factor IIB family protein [Halopiger aswanensis]|uniref:transcription initiation factor IIB family protein n=1 Tax=Halopiger aswanensis TaxID=148449 RepID=UPI0014744BFA|nr:transcription initiation factor IIB family protein [Halopiger aswanensis]